MNVATNAFFIHSIMKLGSKISFMVVVELYHASQSNQDQHAISENSDGVTSTVLNWRTIKKLEWVFMSWKAFIRSKLLVNDRYVWSLQRFQEHKAQNNFLTIVDMEECCSVLNCITLSITNFENNHQKPFQITILELWMDEPKNPSTHGYHESLKLWIDTICFQVHRTSTTLWQQ